MSEVINKYLDFGGLQKYDLLIKDFIAKGNVTLADKIDALTAKIGNIDVEGSDSKTLAEIVEDIYASIADIVEKQGSLDGKDRELEDKINGIIGDVELGDSDAVMTLAEIANKLKAIDTSVSKNADDIAGVAERVSTLEGTIDDLKNLGGENGLVAVVDKVNSNVAAIEKLNGEADVEGSVKKAAADAQAAAIAAAEAAAAQALADAKADTAESLKDYYTKEETDGLVDALNGNIDSAAAEAQAAAEATAAADATSKAAAAESAAKTYADSLVKDAEGKSLFDAAGSAATAEQNAKDYADSLATNYDAAGAAAAAQTAAIEAAAADATSKADAAQAAAIADAESKYQVKGDYEAAGAAADALDDAKDYADSLATNYDAAGAAATAQAAAEANAKTHAVSLVQNEDGSSKFDAAGSADAAQSAAIAHANEVAGANTELINSLSDRIGSLEGISKAANVVYNDQTGFINIVDKDGNIIGEGFSASPFIVDGMLKGVSFVDDSDSETLNTTLRFTFNTDAGVKDIDVDFSDYVDVYHADGSSIELNSSTNTFSVKNVDASKTTLKSSIEVNGGPLANDTNDANDKWPDDWYENGVKVIPSGKSMEEILTSLFLKVTNGTVKKGSITWSPSLSAPSVSITQSGTVEVGTKITATANTTNTVSGNSRTCVFTCSPGHFLSTGVDENGKLVFGSYNLGNKNVTANEVNPSYDGTPSIKTYWNGTEVANVNGTTEYTVSIEGNNTFKVDQSGVTAYAGAFDDITVYGSTNTKDPVESVKASITGDTAPAAKPLTSTASKTVKGARAYWMGAMATPLSEFTSASIREAGEDSDSGLTKTLGDTPATTISVPAGQYDVVIATRKEISVVTSAAQFGSAITGNFTANHTEVNIEGANGFTADKYHVYHCNASWDEDTLTITYK